MGSNKNDLRKMARSVGAKISYRPPGQGSKDLSKDGIVCRIMEKEFLKKLESAEGATAAAGSGPSNETTPPPPSIASIHDNFRLVNDMFSEDIIEISTECGSSATRNQLDTNMVGANSPFWRKVSSLFHCVDGCDPCTDGIDFLDKVHFEHTFYSQHCESIDPSKHGKFPNDKLRSMWSKIKTDYETAMVNFTKSGNHASSFTAEVMRELRRQEKGKSRAVDANGIANDSSVESSEDEDEEYDVAEDPEGTGEKGFANFTRSLVVIYLRQWLNEKPEQTNFCSRQLPIDAQSDSLATAATTTTATLSSTKKRKKKQTGREAVLDLVTELIETRKNKTSSTAFGLAASPATRKMKKHINVMLRAQSKSAQTTAQKDQLSLLQTKLMVAKENAANFLIGSQDRKKADALLTKLQKKLNDLLNNSSESERASDGDDSSSSSSAE